VTPVSVETATCYLLTQLHALSAHETLCSACGCVTLATGKLTSESAIKSLLKSHVRALKRGVGKSDGRQRNCLLTMDANHLTELGVI
jgi:hypothetical protein